MSFGGEVLPGPGRSAVAAQQLLFQDGLAEELAVQSLGIGPEGRQKMAGADVVEHRFFAAAPGGGGQFALQRAANGQPVVVCQLLAAQDLLDKAQA